MDIKENVDLKPYTYFKIGGPARFFAEVSDADQLREAIRFAKSRSLPFYIFGSASNVLVADDGFSGLVIRMMLRDITRDSLTLRAGAGVPNAIAVARTLAEKLAGFEWAIGIPGSIGGSVRGNAGCFSGEMKDVLKSVRFFNSQTGEIEEGDNTFCRFGYRDSIFKHSPHLVILDATLELREWNPDTSQRLVRYYSSSRTDAQDIGLPSAGCVFKNVLWPQDEKAKKRLLSREPHLADFEGQLTIPAGWLIDQLGLKGKAIGRVSISRKHANYMINNGGASAEEVIMLIGLVKEYVHRKFGLQLEEEIQYVGFHS